MIIKSKESLFYLEETELVKFTHDEEEIHLLYKICENGDIFYVVANRNINLTVKINENDLLNHFLIRKDKINNIKIMSNNIIKLNNSVSTYKNPLYVNILTIKDYLIGIYKSEGIDIDDDLLNKEIEYIREESNNIINCKDKERGNDDII